MSEKKQIKDENLEEVNGGVMGNIDDPNPKITGGGAIYNVESNNYNAIYGSTTDETTDSK